MITVKDFMELVDYRITEGGTYCWNCYGPNAYSLDFWNQDQDGFTVCIVFDTKNQTVYQAEAFDYSRERAYRLINPDYKKAHDEEAKQRNVDGDQAWDEVQFVDLETEEDFLSKARAIINGEDYDTRVSIPVDFTDEELLKYMTMAHERDMTFNQFVEEALRHAIEEYKRDPEGLKQRWSNK